MVKVNRRTTRLMVGGMDLTPFVRAENNRRAAWFKYMDAQVKLYAARTAPAAIRPSVGTYAGAKAAAHESAVAYVERELNRPTSSLNHGSAFIAGRLYHWRQDYTGQLKLAAGASPW